MQTLEQIKALYIGKDHYRKASWQKFQSLGFFEAKQEIFRYLHLKELFSRSYGRAHLDSLPPISPYQECREACLVFVNGNFCMDLSQLSGLPKSAVVLPFSNAQSVYGAYLQQRWDKLIQEEQDPFAALNGALFDEGAFLYFPAGCNCETPIQILHVISADAPSHIVPRIHLYCGKKAQASFLACVQMKGDHWMSSVVDCVIEEGGKLEIASLFNEDGHGWHFEAVRAMLKSHAHFRHLSFTNGNRTMRQDFKVALAGNYAEAFLGGGWFCRQKKEAHVNVLIDHKQPHNTSMQRFKGVLDDRGRSSFEGKIRVRPEAQKTEAYQLNHNLLLSDRAMAFSKPNLEIQADDVKASHGATVGPLDEELLFYLKSRGIASQELLVQGFLNEVCQEIRHASLRNETEQLFFPQ